mmetsp:Transcript_84081/g.171425  ORF Transcript_84081/g.171425 Transcript_84081/m.171425 type:complete len:235 (-) Transcript_84081:147-851(-)
MGKLVLNEPQAKALVGRKELVDVGLHFLEQENVRVPAAIDKPLLTHFIHRPTTHGFAQNELVHLGEQLLLRFRHLRKDDTEELLLEMSGRERTRQLRDHPSKLFLQSFIIVGVGNGHTPLHGSLRHHISQRVEPGVREDVQVVSLGFGHLVVHHGSVQVPIQLAPQTEVRVGVLHVAATFRIEEEVLHLVGAQLLVQVVTSTSCSAETAAAVGDRAKSSALCASKDRRHKARIP